jgi:prepilin-type N-terminal cleavage/methylation domain-containing protein
VIVRGSPGRIRAGVVQERGDTLVEVMMAIAIAGIAVTGLLSGLATAINLSGTHRGQANAGVVLVSAADSVKSQTYVACPSVTTSSYNPTSGVTLPTGWSASNVTITAVKSWSGSSFQASCPATDQKLQLITVRAATPDGRSSEQVDVIKRDGS